jgi:hypothetical protein
MYTNQVRTDKQTIRVRTPLITSQKLQSVKFTQNEASIWFFVYIYRTSGFYPAHVFKWASWAWLEKPAQLFRGLLITIHKTESYKSKTTLLEWIPFIWIIMLIFYPISAMWYILVVLLRHRLNTLNIKMKSIFPLSTIVSGSIMAIKSLL